MSPEAAKVPVTVEGRTLVLSNLAKVLYPETGFTKAAVIDYYQRIAPVLLPHIADRPLTLKRYPDGDAHAHRVHAGHLGRGRRGPGRPGLQQRAGAGAGGRVR